MATVNCPSCGKPNPDTVDICQYCGTALKKSSTVPLPPLHPGDMPTKKKTSDLESTLPGWLRDIRQASGDEGGSAPEEKPAETSKSIEPIIPQPAKPATPKQKDAASPLDFLAGLSQANDDEEETPDWLKSLQTDMPAAPAVQKSAPEQPAEEPADWLSALQSETPGSKPPAAIEPDWGFGNQPATFNFDESAEQASQISDETPDWLNALKAQTDEPAHPTAFEPPSPAQPTEWQAPDTETPDWLSALSDSGIGTTPLQSEPVQQTPAQSGETPDWLSALSDTGAASVPPAEPAQQQSIQADDTPDWLASLSSSETGGTPAEQQSATSDDTADWLASLGGNDVARSAQQPTTSSTPAEETPDWLSSLSGSETGLTDQLAAESAPDTGTPDWLSGLDESKPAAAQQPSAPSASQADDTPDWLASLGGIDAVSSEPFAAAGTPLGDSSPAPAQQPSTPNASDEDDTPDWLASLGGTGAVASEPFNAASAADKNDDWLSSLGSGISATEPAPSSAAAQQPDDGMSDWLSSLGSSAAQTEPAPGTTPESIPASDVDLPPWLSDLTSDVQPTEVSSEQVAPVPPTLQAAQPEESDIPTWMADLQGTSTTEAPASADLPDWMAGLPTENLQTPPAEVSGVAPSTDSEIPSWLADAMGEEPADKPASGGKPFDTGALRELGPMDETPGWMAQVGGPSPTPVEIPEENSPRAPEPVFPSSSEAPTAPPASGEENMDAIFSMDMPDWLSGFSPAEAEANEPKSIEQPTEDNISPADLPSWVQAMRPVEDVMGGKIAQADDEEAIVENQGPLAGLRSVLPGLPSVPTVHKPKTYSIKLQVADTQQAQAALLEKILSSESLPQVTAKRSEAVVIRPLRWIIAGILLFTILLGALLPDITRSPVFPAPDKTTEHSHIGDFKTIIDKLPENTNVLLVVDYQPGFAGELEPAAGPVLDQLMAKNMRLAFISTTPVGSYMAERLVQKFSAKIAYQSGTQYANLGYLPGGAGGIQVFAELPLATVGQDWFLGNLWEQDALKAVKKFNEFSAVIVMTDNPDTGRLWIEQAEPSLRPQPMLMVTSAQAEPMIRPYLASGQIKGMISGLEDGALYESLPGQTPGQARSYWDPFGVAVLAAELLIIVGGVWGLVTSYRANRAKKTEQDEA